MNNYYQGRRALEKREYARAIGFFSRALMIDAADIDSLAERGFAHLEVGEFEEAHRDCQAVLRLDASHGRGCELREKLSPENTAQLVAAANQVANTWLDVSEVDEICVANSPAETVFGYQTSLGGSTSETPPEVDVGPPIESTDAAAAPVEASNPAADEGATAADAPPPEPAEPVPGADLASAEIDEYGLAPAAGRAYFAEPAPPPVSSRVPPRAQPAPAAAGDSSTEEQVIAGAPAAWSWRSAWVVGRAGLVSALVHAALLVALALVVVHVNKHSDELEVLATTLPAQGGMSQPFSFTDSQESDATSANMPVSMTLVSARLASVPKIDMTPKIEPRSIGSMELALDERGMGVSAGTNLLREFSHREITVLGELRSEEGKQAALIARGGTPQSEAAVARALDWLVRHQNYDGSWNFDHTHCGTCKGACGNPGSLVDARVGATALALLPFLGAGHTHVVDKYGDASKYGKTVQGGLRFLMRSQRKDGGMNEQTGRMYDHGLASIVFCEAYGMTQDRGLLKPAERALGFIVYAQDPIGGGWRYQPQMPGDTSVVGWQLMAIKSGQMAYLKVPTATINGASNFLDSVAMDSGSGYGYVNNFTGTEATSAVGLLCRMYLGWTRENPALTRGVQALAATEPSTSNMYFNYYATQVLHHYEGPLWVKWNDTMRDYLVRSQSERGHETGSWFFDGDRHGSRQGGRLYATCMAAMTLEVYYHHMPLYSTRALHDKLGQ